MVGFLITFLKKILFVNYFKLSERVSPGVLRGRGIRFPWNWNELPAFGVGIGPLQEQYMLLASELSL